MNVARLLRMDGTLTNFTVDGVSDDHTPESSSETVAVKCWIEQVSSSESTAVGEVEADDWRIYLPAGTACAGTSKLVVGDVELEFAGPPWPAVNPRTAVESHIEAKGRRVR